MVTLRPDEFDRVSATPGWYIVARDHYKAYWDIVRQERTYLVVQEAAPDRAGEPLPAS
jgi:hypothetical protein